MQTKHSFGCSAPPVGQFMFYSKLLFLLSIVHPDQPHEPGWLGGELNGKVGWFPEAYAEPASNPVKVETEEPIAAGDSVKDDHDSNLYVALFPYNSEGLLFTFWVYFTKVIPTLKLLL